MTAFTIAQLIKYSGGHDLRIVVVDNKPSDGSHKYLEPLKEHFLYVPYPEEKLQSHGIAISYAGELGYIETEYFLCLENDAYPTGKFIEYYQRLINAGFDAAGSVLRLSGGEYLHPCAALYRTSMIIEAEIACRKMPFFYFPNMSVKDGFACHLMVNKETGFIGNGKLINSFIAEPDDWVELADGYRPYFPQLGERKCVEYMPTVCAFHNGMGGNEESIKTYGGRNPNSEVDAILAEDCKIVNRMGYEPGQWLHYWMLKTGKKIFEIPTEVKWMNGREGQQQEYSFTESNIRHIWGVSSYTERPAEGVEDIYAEKRNIPEQLYNSLPKHQRI
jgi:hypothetical protein